MKDFNVMPTETMLLLALKQQNWSEALKIVKNMNENFYLPFYQALQKAILNAKKEDEKAIIFLNLWTEVSWKIKK